MAGELWQQDERISELWGIPQVLHTGLAQKCRWGAPPGGIERGWVGGGLWPQLPAWPLPAAPVWGVPLLSVLWFFPQIVCLVLGGSRGDLGVGLWP